MAQKKKKKTKMAKRHKTLPIARLVGGLLGVLCMVLIGMLGWQWASGVVWERTVISGVHHADADDLLALAGLDSGQVMMSIDPNLVADRLRRHPWVQEARVTRRPTGTLSLALQERTPTLLVMDRSGRPSHYLDRDGFAMPLTPGVAYDVPVLRGLREPYHPVRQLEHKVVRALLTSLAAADPETDALLSELEMQPSGEVWLYTTPIEGRGSIPVSLGRDHFTARLLRLRAFWQQVLWPQPQKSFAFIDLRFEGQVVTRETG